MRTFVLEVSFIRSMQFDVGGILQRVKEHQEEHRKVALDALRARMRKENSKVASFLRDTYKKVANSYLLDIDEKYVSERIRSKWSRVCQYYN
jgi:sulfur relay (sulfurtransferase) DsrC/TusE family protein